jgi:cytochrome c peroxidase
MSPALATKAMHNEGMYTYSCASCHHVDAGFQAGRVQGIGDGGMGFGIKGEARTPSPHYGMDELDVQPIRTPSALNVAFQPNMLWNGQFGATHLNEGTEAQWTEGTPKAVNYLGYQGVEIQAIAGLEVHRMEINEDLISMRHYAKYFDIAFADIPKEERYNNEHAGLAIAAYERTLLANQAPFQRWLQGESDAMTPTQKRGAALFFGKANCGSCHAGPALNEMNFYALGMPDLDGPGVYGSSDDATNKGRGGFTGKAEDMYKFKVPQLYNLKDSPFFGHGGNFRSIREVIEYKNEAIPANPNVPADQLAEEFVPLGLTENEIDALTAFIQNGLHDPALHRYLPEYLPSGLCFPNNDPRSKQELGCE